MLNILDEAAARGMLCYVADRVIESKGLLAELDGKIGDGDHGITMAGGMKKAKDAVQALPDSGNVYALFEAAGKAMLMGMGGASGVLFSSLYLAGAKGIPPKRELMPEDIAILFERGLATIKERGKARIGDKTMVDALEPAVDAMLASAGMGMLPMLQAAEEAAARGVAATKGYIARFGRAKSLMERAVGHQDAGATSVWIILRSMREYAES